MDKQKFYIYVEVYRIKERQDTHLFKPQPFAPPEQFESVYYQFAGYAPEKRGFKPKMNGDGGLIDELPRGLL